MYALAAHCEGFDMKPVTSVIPFSRLHHFGMAGCVLCLMQESSALGMQRLA